MEQKTGIDLAIERFEGSPTKLANAIGGSVLRQHVEHWVKAGRVPADKAPEVEAATGVPCEALCPGVRWDVLRGQATQKPELIGQDGAPEVHYAPATETVVVQGA